MVEGLYFYKAFEDCIMSCSGVVICCYEARNSGAVMTEGEVGFVEEHGSLVDIS